MIEKLSRLPDFVRAQKYTTCFVDTSVLFSATYPFDRFNESIEPLFTELLDLKVAPITNVNVKSEFLENHRQVLIPECLCDFYEDFQSEFEENLGEILWKHRKNYRQSMADGRAVKFDVNQIANFKRRLQSFYSSRSDNGWTFFCETYLAGKLEPIWDNAEELLGLNLISVREGDKSPYLNSIPEWPQAISIMGRHGIASNDAMILNMFLCSKIPALLTADLELAQVTVKESKGQKRVFVPESLLTN